MDVDDIPEISSLEEVAEIEQAKEAGDIPQVCTTDVCCDPKLTNVCNLATEWGGIRFRKGALTVLSLWGVSL